MRKKQTKVDLLDGITSMDGLAIEKLRRKIKKFATEPFNRITVRADAIPVLNKAIANMSKSLTETQQILLAGTMGFNTRAGLITLRGEVVELPEADTVARHYGFTCAERMVKAMEKFKGE